MAASKGTRIFVTRHGISEHNMRTDVFMGRSPESPLTKEGRAQATRLGRRLAKEAKITRIISSSLRRTMETAELIAAEAGCGAPLPEDAFWELDKGSWEGVMPVELPPEIVRQVADAPFTYRYGGGESYKDVQGRVGPAFDRWVREFPKEKLLFVLHGDVIRALLHHVIRFPEDKISDFEIDPCSISELIFTNGRYRVLRLNDAGHTS